MTDAAAAMTSNIVRAGELWERGQELCDSRDVHDGLLHFLRARALLSQEARQAQQSSSGTYKMVMDKLASSIEIHLGVISANPVIALGLSRKFNRKDVKKAYHKFSLKYHPDKNLDCDTSCIFTVLQCAYDKLKDVATSTIDSNNHTTPRAASSQQPSSKSTATASGTATAGGTATATPATKKETRQTSIDVSSMTSDTLRSMLRKYAGYSNDALDGMDRDNLTRKYLKVAQYIKAIEREQENIVRSHEADRNRRNRADDLSKSLPKMGVSELRRLMTASGLPFDSVLEKKDMVDQLCVFYGISLNAAGAVPRGYNSSSSSSSAYATSEGPPAAPEERRAEDAVKPSLSAKPPSASSTSKKVFERERDSLRARLDAAGYKPVSSSSAPYPREAEDEVLPMRAPIISTEKLQELEAKLLGSSYRRPAPQSRPAGSVASSISDDAAAGSSSSSRSKVERVAQDTVRSAGRDSFLDVKSTVDNLSKYMSSGSARISSEAADSAVMTDFEYYLDNMSLSDGSDGSSQGSEEGPLLRSDKTVFIASEGARMEGEGSSRPGTADSAYVRRLRQRIQHTDGGEDTDRLGGLFDAPSHFSQHAQISDSAIAQELQEGESRKLLFLSLIFLSYTSTLTNRGRLLAQQSLAS